MSQQGAPAPRPTSFGVHSYSTHDPELDSAIRELVNRTGTPNADLIGEMVITAIKLAQDGADRGDLKIVNTALKEMRHAFRVFHDYRQSRKVAIFGSARTPADHPEYQQARELAQRLAELEYMVITGAGPGIMRAGHEGATPDKSFGVNIRLPFEQTANDVILGSPRLINFKYFFTRKLSFVKESDAIVLLPGGFGTMDEGFESLTLVQTGKSRIMPIVFLDSPGGQFWKEWDRYVRGHLLAGGRISKADLALYIVTDDVSTACAEITRFYHNFHSARFVRDVTVLRTLRPVPPEGIAQLQSDFKDIIEGPITSSQPLPEEREEQALAQLPRLAFKFNRRHYGRLRQMIDAVNVY